MNNYNHLSPARWTFKRFPRPLSQGRKLDESISVARVRPRRELGLTTKSGDREAGRLYLKVRAIMHTPHQHLVCELTAALRHSVLRIAVSSHERSYCTQGRILLGPRHLRRRVSSCAALGRLVPRNGKVLYTHTLGRWWWAVLALGFPYMAEYRCSGRHPSEHLRVMATSVLLTPPTIS
jgi:hypothetical protein